MGSIKQGTEFVTVKEPAEEALLRSLWRLYFNPPRYKHMKFQEGGVISEGANDNENKWRIVDGALELLQRDGKVHNRFTYTRASNSFYATGESGKGIPNQYMSSTDD